MTRTLERRNIAIIAHVDHGKTTLVDQLLRQSGAVRDNQQMAERALDRNDLERERGITILAKCTAVEWQGIRFNIVDTPGHADFGGEVERILTMVDGVILLVDAAEGAMPQTKFVTQKALEIGLKPILVINKVDRPDGRVDAVLDEVFDLFAALGADDEQLDFPVLYASGRDGWASVEPEGPKDSLNPLFELVRDHVPAPIADASGPFAMLASLIESDPFLGRVLTGRVYSGVAKVNAPLKALNLEGKVVETGRITKLFAYDGLNRVPVEQAEAGDLIAIAGLAEANVADTLCDPSVTEAIPAPPIDPPTLSMTFSINSSPLAGTEGSKVTTRMIRARLLAEAEGNVALEVEETEDKDAYQVSGRGELQLGVLIETMRREGFELSISRPRVIFREDPDTGQRQEPMEEVVIDVDEEHSGVVVESMGVRRAELREMKPAEGGKTRLVFLAPSRGLIGYHGQFLTETRGTGVMNRLFHSYGPDKGVIPGRRNGVLISNASGKTVAYALWGLEERGALFVPSGVKVYEGMIIGENSRPNDLEVNPMKAKQLTNIRAAGTDEAIRLTPPRKLTLEQAIAYIEDDELVEVTPENIRLRKRFLDPHERKKHQRRESAA